MSADLLREAAAKMRERAEVATPGPWECAPLTAAGRVWVQMQPRRRGRADLEPLFNVRNEGAYKQREHDAEHIASWHPAVALAVADWLDALADIPVAMYEPTPATETVYGRGLAVARAYLGRK